MSKQAELVDGEILSEEARLVTAIQDLLLMPKSRVAVWLHLAELAPALPKPHHRRVAHAIMEAAAHHHDGDVFSLANGDLVLLCRAPSHDGIEPAAHPAALSYTFSRLLQASVANAAELTRTWRLEHDGATLLSHVAQLRMSA